MSIRKTVILLLKTLFCIKISFVKKTVLIFILALIVLSAVPALDWGLDIALGVPSYIGLNLKKGSFEFNFGINTSFGVGGLLTSFFMDNYISTNMTPLEKFSYGNKLINGLSLGVYYTVLDSSSFNILLGANVTALHFSSKEGVINHFTKGDIVLFNVNAKASFQFSHRGISRSSIFLKAGFPLFAYINYGGDKNYGDKNNTNYLPFDFWAFIPTAIIEIEEGNYIDIKATQLALIFIALDFKIGYCISF